MSATAFQHVLVPVASKADAEATARALSPYMTESGGVALVTHVIEKAGGAPDKASVEQREENAREIFEVFRAVVNGKFPVETHISYGTDTAETIIERADEAGASAIVFTPRGGSRWIKLLTGDVTHGLVENATMPVLVLPDGETDG